MSAAGYSGRPLAQKLGIKEGHAVVLLRAPDGFAEHGLGALPDGVTIAGDLRGGTDVVVTFQTERVAIETERRAITHAIWPGGAWWVCWPKRASKVPTDITEDVVRDVVLPHGLVDNKVCAVDETWSGLRVVVRREHRAGSAEDLAGPAER